MFEWIFPVILGVYFPVFSSQTHTAAIVTVFYALVFLHSVSTWRQLMKTGCRDTICSLMGNDLMVLGTMLKASCVGLPYLVHSKNNSSWCLCQPLNGQNHEIVTNGTAASKIGSCPF